MEVSGFLSVHIKDSSRIYALKVDGGSDVIHLHDIVYEGIVYPSVPLHPKLLVCEDNIFDGKDISLRKDYSKAIYMSLVTCRESFQRKGNDLIIRSENLDKIIILEGDNIPKWVSISKDRAQKDVDQRQMALNFMWEENKALAIEEAVNKAMSLLEQKRDYMFLGRFRISDADINAYRRKFTERCHQLIQNYEKTTDKKAIENKYGTYCVD